MSMRVTVILSEEEYTQAKRKAGLIPLSAWFRSRIWDEENPAPDGRMRSERARGREKRNNPSLGKVGVKDGRGEKNREDGVREVKDVVSSERGVNKVGGDKPIAKAGKTCAHGMGKGEHCWQCMGLAKVE